METIPGTESSRITLHVEKVNMLKAIKAAVDGAGKSDIAIGDDLAVNHIGLDGTAFLFSAAYSPAEEA